jgi:hypothetical protein
MNRSDVQEQLAALYLRLNGYFVTGFIAHAAHGEENWEGRLRTVRTEIDIVAVRFPHNAEPEREIGTSEYLMVPDDAIHVLICEVKGGTDLPLHFNSGLVNGNRGISSLLRWIGMFEEGELRELFQPIKDLLTINYKGIPTSFEELRFRPKSIGTDVVIRPLFFAPDRPSPGLNQPRYINGQEITHFIWRCFRPELPRDDCETRYDFGLWGIYEDIVREFKAMNRQQVPTMADIYASIEERI